MNRLSTIIMLLALWLTAGAEKPYFQQWVRYDIKADIDPESAKIAGIENIVYFNNSPDTLSVIYFHLYFNAFQPGSYLDRQGRREGDYSIANSPRRNQGYVNIDELGIDGRPDSGFSIDNTIMTVPLSPPLAPGDSVEFYIEFTSQIPARGSRTARAGKHLDVGQWYPKPAVYDRYGWHNHQYLDYEFYADFGDFHVELTIPSEYIVAHMGVLLNEEEIFGDKLPLPEGDSVLVDVLAGLKVDSLSPPETNDRENNSTSDHPYDEELANIPAAPGESDTVGAEGGDKDRKTWMIEAKNVHDFAFCADPKFILDLARYNDVIIKSYYYESVEDIWRHDAAEFTRKGIRLFSERFYPYPYTQYSTVAALVGGGMEYPQLTMVNRRAGRRGDFTHGLESIIAHEVGHAWFYGILGFNETEQSYLDEGLASFSNTIYLEHYYGRFGNNFSYKKSWQRKLLPNGNERNDEQRSYIIRARNKDEDPAITPANLFATGGRYYNASYQKANSIYWMLQYTMGEERFRIFLRLLFERWALKHPYLSDFQELAEEVYGGDLDWFFRQWFTTTWSLDYSLDDFHREKTELNGTTGYNATVKIGKKGRCISPLDIAIKAKDGSTESIEIPLAAWEDGQSSFDTTIFLTAKPTKAIINPDGRLADIDRLNNSSGLPPVRFQLLLPEFVFRQSYVEHYVNSYTVAHQPLLWYNSIDGIKPGYRFSGSYIGQADKIDLNLSVGALKGKVDHNLAYENIIYNIDPDLSYFLSAREEEGRGRQAAGISLSREYGFRSNYLLVSLSLKRSYVYDEEYIHGLPWSPGDDSAIEFKMSRGFRKRFSRFDFEAGLESSIPGGNYDFTRARGGLLITLLGVGGNDTRLHLQAGVSNGNLPYQRRFFLSTADPYEIWDSQLFRSKGTLPDRWKNDGYLFKPGGAGLSGYLSGDVTGTRMLSMKLSRELPSFRLPIRLPVISRQLGGVNSELYAVSGLVWERGHNPRLGDYLSEAGIRLQYDVPILDRLIRESSLVLYLPIWLSDPSEEEQQIEWRWLFSLLP